MDFDYLLREKSLITGKANLEPLYALKRFPVFMGCTEEDPGNDVFADMEWQICTDSGIIQLGKLLPLEFLYLQQHNEGCGSVWQEHYDAFSQFLLAYNPRKVLEIGGAHGLIAKKFLTLSPKTKWTIVEPNPTFGGDANIKVVKAWFDEDFKFHERVDAVVHSHVLEHVYDPDRYLSHIGKFLKKGGRHVFTFPNMVEMLKRKYTNCLNFEHTVFLSEYFADYFLAKNGFKILAKEYFKDHSIFYATERVDSVELSAPKLENKYDEYKKLFMDFIEYHRTMVADLNKRIEQSNDLIYLFGAHIFSQYLITFGLKTEKIKGILDNGPAKQGKRLYGTALTVFSPKVVTNMGAVKVILKAGIYNEEIKKDILENINEQVEFW